MYVAQEAHGSSGVEVAAEERRAMKQVAQNKAC